MGKKELPSRGSSGERTAVSVVTILFDVLFMISLPSVRFFGWSLVLRIYLITGAMIVIIELFRDSLPPIFTALPLIIYTGEAIVCTVLNSKYLGPMSGIFAVLTLILLGKACVCMIKAKMGSGDRAKREFNACMMALFLAVILDLLYSMLELILGSTGWNIVGGFISRTLFTVTVICLGRPDTILLNVRRLIRLAAMWIVPVAIVFSAVKGVSCLTNTLRISIRGALMLAALVATDVLAVGCLIRYFFGNPWKEDEKSEVMISKTRTFRDIFYTEADLDLALQRDYLTEYRCRFINDAKDREEIRMIRDRLYVLHEEREILLKTECNETRLRRVEAEAAELLGRLSFFFHFTTGFDTFELNDDMDDYGSKESAGSME